jgi:hypothetical protein
MNIAALAFATSYFTGEQLSSEKDAEVALRFALQKLGLVGPLGALDALTQAALPGQEGQMTLPLRSQEWRLLWLRPQLAP